MAPTTKSKISVTLSYPLGYKTHYGSYILFCITLPKLDYIYSMFNASYFLSTLNPTRIILYIHFYNLS